LEIYRLCLPNWDDDRLNMEWLVEQILSEIDELENAVVPIQF